MMIIFFVKRNYLYMIFLFFLLVICFCVFKLIVIKDNDKHIFFKVTKFDIKSTILNIVKSKLNKVISLSTCIDKLVFDKVGLIVAPVYVLDVKKIGIIHLKIFLNAIKNIDKKLNLVLINSDKVNVKSFGNVNIVLLTEKKLDYNVISLLNMLNVNKDVKYGERELKYDYELKNFTIDFECVRSAVTFNKGVHKLVLPYVCFGYITKVNKSTQVCDAFGKVLIEINRKLNVRIFNNNLYISVNKKTETIWRFYLQEKALKNLQLFNFDIEINEFANSILWLKEKAIDELCENPLKEVSESRVNVKNLKDFFKIVKLRKQYLGDYLYLVKNIFGLRVCNDILNSCPCEFITEDYIIKYRLEGEEYCVNFSSNSSNDNKTLYGVGHKIGVKDKFVYGFKY